MKNWTLPMAVASNFAANDYVSACEPKIYTFDCNTEWGTIHCDNQEDHDLLMSMIPNGYTNVGAGCGITHEYVDGDKLVPGWSDYNENGVKDVGEEILVWFDKNDAGEYDFAGVHLTNKIDMNTWETNMS